MLSDDLNRGGEEDFDGEEPASRDSRANARLPKIIHFEEICRCGDEIWIEERGQIYRLRRTKLGKLILTK